MQTLRYTSHMEITLLRHGKPTAQLEGYIKAEALKELAKAYAESEISDTPPPQSIALAKHCNIVVCSDLTRSVTSAKALGIDEPFLIDSVFKETTLPHFNHGKLRLPIGLWLGLLRLMWLLGYAQNGESFRAAKARARIAAQQLIQLAQEHDTVLLVGHGVFNHLIAKELLRNHWLSNTPSPRKYWEFSGYTKDLSCKNS